MASRLLVIVLGIALAGLTACGNKQLKHEQKQIAELEKQLYSEKGFDLNNAVKLIDLYVQFETTHRGDTLGAEYLFKAAEVASSIQAGNQAILYYDRILVNYPDWSKAPDCLFLKAFMYENLLKNNDEAKRLYQLFIEYFPNHEFADDAQALIDNMGLSPEELIRKFEQQNQTQK